MRGERHMGMLIEEPDDTTPTGDAYYTVGAPDDLCIWGDDLKDTLTGGIGNDAFYGMAGADTIDGGAGDDRLDGGTGADTLTGGAGNDLYIIDNIGDRAIESATTSGTDTVQTSISWTLGTGLENLTLTGSANLNGAGNGLTNVLIGNDGNNVLSAGAGNDTLDGGAGRDSLTGGTGADTFVFHTQTAYGTPDTVTDFKSTQGDKLDLTDVLSAYDPLTKALSDFVHITSSGNNTIVSVDADGLGASFSFQTVATLAGVHGLPSVDMLVAHGNLVV